MGRLVRSATRLRPELLLALACLVGIAAGGLAHLLNAPTARDVIWAATAGLLLVPLTWSVAGTLLRKNVGVDAIALVAIAAALALGEYLAAAVVALMLSGGSALEAYAAGRARRELRSLVERVPRVATRRDGDVVAEILVGEVDVGDLIVVRPGAVVPVDGILLTSEAVLDESALTGEPLPVSYREGQSLRSGAVNASAPFELRAARRAEESAYAAIVRLVEAAERERAPFVRLADRYAAIFLPLTLAIAGLAWWLSGEPVRAVAVLVVATPCPLILAAPVAFMAGVSRAARAGIIVKGGAAIEQLGEARTVLLDKTGTLTLGTPTVDSVVPFDSGDTGEVLELAASLDQLSSHPLAAALVAEARRGHATLSFPTEVEEGLGRGISGRVNGHDVAIGSSEWLAELGYPDALDAARRFDRANAAGRGTVLVGIDGALRAGVVMADHLRDDARELVTSLRRCGIRHVAMVTGDRIEVAEAVGREVGVDRVYAEQSPEDKVEVVRAVRARPELGSVVMVGDGVNDAPALALADVGIAMGSAGATASSETADAVIVVDRIGRVADAVRIGRRSLRIARESVLVGIGLSLIAMGFAAFGFIGPVFGALLQEAIDVGVILNALRALRG